VRSRSQPHERGRLLHHPSASQAFPLAVAARAGPLRS
jgi:hypothetical protein